MTFLGLGMFSMCNVRHELHNTGKKTDKLETLMIRIGMFSGELLSRNTLLLERNT